MTGNCNTCPRLSIAGRPALAQFIWDVVAMASLAKVDALPLMHTAWPTTFPTSDNLAVGYVKVDEYDGSTRR